MVFVDEKPFELNGNLNSQNTRSWKKRSEKHTVPIIKQEKHNTIVHSICGVSWQGKTDVRFYVKERNKKRGTGN